MSVRDVVLVSMTIRTSHFLQDSALDAAGASPHQPSKPGPGAISTGPPRLTPLRESQLVELHRKGDPEAMTELLEAYQRRIYSICFRTVHDAELARDLAQDSMVKVLEGLGTYDGRSKLSTAPGGELYLDRPPQPL